MPVWVARSLSHNEIKTPEAQDQEGPAIPNIPKEARRCTCYEFFFSLSLFSEERGTYMKGMVKIQIHWLGME